MGEYVGSLVEVVVNILLYNAGFAHCLTPQKHYLNLSFSRHGTALRRIHFSNIIPNRKIHSECNT